MGMKRIITQIVTKNVIINLEDEMEGYVVKDISFFRDGLIGVNRGCKNEAHYRVTMVNAMAGEKDVKIKVIPEERREELTFADVEVEDKDEAKVRKA